MRKVVRVSADEYEKGCRRGEQISWMRLHYAQHPTQLRLYDLGVANIKRLNDAFHAHTDEYWRGYADGLVTESAQGASASL